MAYGPTRLLLVDYDELLILWDALRDRKLAVDVGDPEWADVVRLQERVGELLSSSLDALVAQQ